MSKLARGKNGNITWASVLQDTYLQPYNVFYHINLLRTCVISLDNILSSSAFDCSSHLIVAMENFVGSFFYYSSLVDTVLFYTELSAFFVKKSL